MTQLKSLLMVALISLTTYTALANEPMPSASQSSVKCRIAKRGTFKTPESVYYDIVYGQMDRSDEQVFQSTDNLNEAEAILQALIKSGECSLKP